MGDYATLRFQAPLNEYGKLLVERLSSPPWPSWRDLVGEFPEVASYAAHDRAEFIPRGGLCYAPEGWEQENKVEDGVWRVCCSIKLESWSTITAFLLNVLPKMVDGPAIVFVYNELSGVTERHEIRADQVALAPLLIHATHPAMVSRAAFGW